VSEHGSILIVDDTPQNVKLIADLLEASGYRITTATSGVEALERLAADRFDLVLLDVMMPGMSGYEVCLRIRQSEETRLLPVVLLTALDPAEERVKGIEIGADDFLSKPINIAELLARVRSLLRIRKLHETVRAQTAQLAEWGETLQRRVDEQLAELERLTRLKRFLAPQVAELISADASKLEPHRRCVTVVFVDLREFTQFAESAEPEEMMAVLGEFHRAVGSLVMEHEGTLERFTGDGMMIFFNDPVEVPDPEERAVRMALAIREHVCRLGEGWSRLGHSLGLGIGITTGYATLGMIGFDDRHDYAAIGNVTNQAARLCAAASDGQILISERVLSVVDGKVEVELVGELALKGFRRPVKTHNVLRLRAP